MRWVLSNHIHALWRPWLSIPGVRLPRTPGVARGLNARDDKVRGGWSCGGLGMLSVGGNALKFKPGYNVYKWGIPQGFLVRERAGTGLKASRDSNVYCSAERPISSLELSPVLPKWVYQKECLPCTREHCFSCVFLYCIKRHCFLGLLKTVFLFQTCIQGLSQARQLEQRFRWLPWP